MEIEQLRKELNDLLDNVVDHSSNYSGNRQIPSLEISYVLTKINKMQETLIILKHLIKEEEKQIKKDKQQKRQLVQKQENVINEVEKETPEFNIQSEIVIEEKEVENSIQEKSEDVKDQIIDEQEITTPITNIEQLPISKLVDAFSLNDRYLYANELFGKDMGAFNEVVKNLDSSNNFEEAKAILISIGSERNWDVEDENVLSFTNLVERRFLYK
ncbi:MAG: hypothetical protein P1U41_10105 [Vicingaceae bacterium]|nr:hypothetical protein [Vicingaceae bacterium]